MHISWKCDVCGCERADEHISVYTSDISDALKLPKGTVMQNVRYCNDNKACIDEVKKINFFKTQR